MMEPEANLPAHGAPPAILFLVFNRLDTAVEVMRAIAMQRPQRLYIAGDGPRGARPHEEAVTREVRDTMLAMIDWPCDVRTLFQDQNLGCRSGVKTAIDWFFANEAEGIILEDDVVPCPDFFRFAAEMLDRYRDEPRVMMISGTNPLGAALTSERFLFSSLGSIWGWATWRDSWARYDVDMRGWGAEAAALLRQRHGRDTANYLQHIFDFHQRHDVDTWDTQWMYALQANDGVSVVPEANLIRNIGVVGTHSSVEMRNHHLAYGKIDWPIRPRDTGIKDDATFRDRLTRELLLPAMRISTLSQWARTFGLHGMLKGAYRMIRKVRSGTGD
ncbi:nucleotide-diphospho-sugar transferase [Sphingomonas sp. BK235]|uniref:nucleotide-diphospho-sugar transferase n=1 Tax=Sphingomonas sp. BK235 TaxID=2512131 RepID=UPI00104BDA96|nr:nucleotide-diphospho-sugar transferase [Sphingomonas sp. BK235]TCP29371.1 hypothetical protein EV292_11815 [Sphingomonas sp. BK235]